MLGNVGPSDSACVLGGVARCETSRMCFVPPRSSSSDPFGQNLNCLAIAYLHPSIPTEGKKMRQAIVSTEVLVECTY